MKTLKNNQYYLMRHGESLANRRGLIAGQSANALDDYGLTSRGAEQVMKAASNTRLSRDTIIVSSDFKRARETAEIMHNIIDLHEPIKLEPLLRERDFGEWELCDHSNYENVWQNDLSHPEQSKNGVETVYETLARALSGLQVLEERYTSKTILLVGHGDVLQILLTHFHSINPRFHRSLRALANADIRSLAQLELTKNTAA